MTSRLSDQGCPYSLIPVTGFVFHWWLGIHCLRDKASGSTPKSPMKNYFLFMTRDYPSFLEEVKFLCNQLSGIADERL